MKILVLIVAILWVSQCFSSRKEELPYTYYVYEREWPGTICMFYNCQPEFLENYNGELFNSHGLWPNGDATNYCAQPGNCMDIPYEQIELMPGLVDVLDQQWVGVYNPSIAFR
jgi:ribonuclease I